MKILSSDEKTLPSLVQYGFAKGLPLLSHLLVFVQNVSSRFLAEYNFLLASNRFPKPRQSASPSGSHWSATWIVSGNLSTPRPLLELPFANFNPCSIVVSLP